MSRALIQQRQKRSIASASGVDLHPGINGRFGIGRIRILEHPVTVPVRMGRIRSRQISDWQRVGHRLAESFSVQDKLRSAPNSRV